MLDMGFEPQIRKIVDQIRVKLIYWYLFFVENVFLMYISACLLAAKKTLLWQLMLCVTVKWGGRFGICPYLSLLILCVLCPARQTDPDVECYLA